MIPCLTCETQSNSPCIIETPSIHFQTNMQYGHQIEKLEAIKRQLVKHIPIHHALLNYL
jgi:hypothetical protein